MFKIWPMILVVFFASAAIAEDYQRLVQLSGTVYRPDFLGIKSLGVKPGLAFDNFFYEENNISIGLGFSHYALPGKAAITRQDLDLRAGYWFNERTIALYLIAGITDTDIASYTEDGNAFHYGLEAKYRIPLADRFDLLLSAGFIHYSVANMIRDTGVPITNNELDNALCAIFSFGLANGCGNKTEKISLPVSNAIQLGVSVGYWL